MMAFVEDKFIIKANTTCCKPNPVCTPIFNKDLHLKELSPGDHKSLLELAPAYGHGLKGKETKSSRDTAVMIYETLVNIHAILVWSSRISSTFGPIWKRVCSIQKQVQAGITCQGRHVNRGITTLHSPQPLNATVAGWNN